MPKHFTTTQEDKTLWPQFIHSKNAKHVLAKLGQGNHDFAQDILLLKSTLSQEQFQRLYANYRQFKHRKANDLITFKIPKATLLRVINYAQALGYPTGDRPSLVDVLHFLSDPVEMAEASTQIRSLVNIKNGE